MKTKIYLFTMFMLMSSMSFSKPCCEEEEFRIEDYGWLAGSWTGDGFGGTSEEIWSPPSKDGTMMGVFRHHNADGSLNFYEFMVLDATGLRLKHFTPDLVGWETKEKFVTFKMKGVTKDRIELGGLIFERLSDTKMHITLKLNRNGTIETEVFQMTRKS